MGAALLSVRARLTQGLLLLASLLGASACSSPDDAGSFEKKAAWAAAAFPAPVLTQQQLQELDEILLVDTRTEAEFAVSHLPGAISWPDYNNSAPPGPSSANQPARPPQNPSPPNTPPPRHQLHGEKCGLGRKG